MKLLTRYLIIRLGVMSLYALLALLTLYSFFDLINEIDNIGKGSYTASTALLYALMSIPSHAYQLMPLAVLIGALLALSQLANNSELSIIKTSGLSTLSLIRILLSFGVMVAFITIVLGEWVAPHTSKQADIFKSAAKYNRIVSASDGVWIKQDNSMIYISEILPDHSLHNIKIWKYNQHFQLDEALHAQNAQIENGHWQLQQVQRSQIQDKQIIHSQQATLQWHNPINEAMLDVLVIKPEQMSLSALSSYIVHLKNNQQQTRQYDVAWWSKLTYPIATIVMALVALAFTPQDGRHQNMGLRIIGGIGLGLLFHFSSQFLSFTSHLYAIPPFIASTLPTFIFAASAFYLIHKHEQR